MILTLLVSAALAGVPTWLVREVADDIPVEAEHLARQGAVVAAWGDHQAWWVGADGRVGVEIIGRDDSEFVLDAAVAPDGRLVAVLGRQDRFEDWIGERIVLLGPGGGPLEIDVTRPQSVAFSPDGALLAVGTNDDVRVIDGAGRQVHAIRLVLRALDDPLYAGLVAPTGRALAKAFGLDDEEAEELVDDELWLGADLVRFLPDGRLFASNAFSHHLLDAAGGVELARFGGGFADAVALDDAGVLWVFVPPFSPQRWSPELERLEPVMRPADLWYTGDLDGDRLVVDGHVADPATGAHATLGDSRSDQVLDAVVVGEEAWLATGLAIERWRDAEADFTPLALDLRRTERDETGWWGWLVGPIAWHEGEIVAGLATGELRAWRADGSPSWRHTIRCPVSRDASSDPRCEPLAMISTRRGLEVITNGGAVARLRKGGLSSRRIPEVYEAIAADGRFFVTGERQGWLSGRRIPGPDRERARSVAPRAGGRGAEIDYDDQLWIDGRVVAADQDAFTPALAWSLDGEALAVALEEEVTIRAVDGTVRASLALRHVRDIGWLPDGRLLLASRVVSLWDPATGALRQWSPSLGYGVDQIAVSPEGDRAAVLQRWEDADRLWVFTVPPPSPAAGDPPP